MDARIRQNALTAHNERLEAGNAQLQLQLVAVQVYVCAYVYVCTYTYVHMCMHVRIRMCIRVCMYAYVCAYVYACNDHLQCIV